MTSQVLGTTYSMDIPTYQAIGALGEKWTGLFPYRYAYDKDAKMAVTMREQISKAKPDLKDISIFTIHGWLSGMLFAEIAERCIKAGKPLTLPNMKAALESITDWDSGGLIGLPVDLRQHRIATGRMYSFNAATKQMDPISDWIRV